MKILKIVSLIIGVCIVLMGCKSENPQTVCVQQLVERISPGLSDHFVFEIMNDQKGDIFELKSQKDNKIIVRGTNVNAICVGVNYYLKNYCKSYVSWNIDNPLELPAILPKVTQQVRHKACVDNRFFLNYCTFGYTMPWWGWSQWEHFIDWMALNGINKPLAITGQEAIWYKVWRKFGLNDTQIRSYFTGPAHLPWHRMSNLDKWGGALPHSWLDNQLLLQKKILSRERQLGMKPVLPAFAGHIPGDLKKVFPKAKISKLGFWGGFPDQYRSHFLDPLDPLFKQIQKAFLEEQTKEFGTDHIYGADPFNEVEPPSWDPEYLALVSKTIYESMAETDSSAQWLQMSWIFYFERKNWTNERISAMVKAVPQDRMILLDYYCENTQVWKMTDSFFGQPFIWSYLGNFGGNTMLAGNLQELNNRMDETFATQGDKLWGVGGTMEALDVNPLCYEMVFDKVWQKDSLNVKNWIDSWADLRCGKKDSSVRAAWTILLDKVYTTPARLGQGALTNARPTLTGSGNWTTDPTIGYSNKDLFNAWELLLQSEDKSRDAFVYDVVNIGRQVLGNHFIVLRDRFTSCYQSGNADSLNIVGKEMIELLGDMDKLLSTRKDFLLGIWIKQARGFGKDSLEADYYEENARNILTTWGDKAQSLNDYANRSWGGLLKGYYGERWRLFVEDVTASVKQGKAFDEEAFYKKITTFEHQWVKGHEKYASEPQGDGITVAQKLVAKYGLQIKKGVK